MQTPLIVRFAAMSASAVITLALVQSMALLGHPRPAPQGPVANTGSPSAPGHCPATWLDGVAMSDTVQDEAAKESTPC
jgi:hypothetical protein